MKKVVTKKQCIPSSLAFLKTDQREKGIPDIFIDILKAFDIAANILLKKTGNIWCQSMAGTFPVPKLPE